MAFPRSTDCVRVVVLGELTLCDRLISWAADVVARLILNQRKTPSHIQKNRGKEISTNSLTGVQL